MGGGSPSSKTYFASKRHCIVVTFLQLPPIKERIIHAYGEDVADTSSLLKVMRTNKGYVGCATPLKTDEKGNFYPNADCRLFWEDIPYGLCIIKNLGELLIRSSGFSTSFVFFWRL